VKTDETCTSGKREVVTFRASCAVLKLIERCMREAGKSKTDVIEEAVEAYWNQNGAQIKACENSPEAIAELVRRLRPAHESTEPIAETIKKLQKIKPTQNKK
jgi:translation initiation factor 2 alpha subunit (eIF-2alpha)